MKKPELLHCFRCGNDWLSPKFLLTGEKPKHCANPDCHSPYWDKPRTRFWTPKKKTRAPRPQ